MIKKLILAIAIITGLSACKKTSRPECTQEACTAEYAYIGALFLDSKRESVSIKEFKVINLRTKQPVIIPLNLPSIDFVAGFQLIASDDNKSEFSNSGDDVDVTAITESGQTKTTRFKIAGGCNCHVLKVSGPEIIVFN